MQTNNKTLGKALGKTVCAALVSAAAFFGAGIQPAMAAQPITRTFCIYDPIGANGFVYQAMQSYVVQAREWGIKLEPKAYTDQQVAAADFKSGKCDMIEMTGVKAIEFEKFSGSLDMAGGLQTYAQERTAIDVMASSKAAKYMRQGPYETVGVVPLGKAYLFSRNKDLLQDINDIAGKKVAVLSYDKQAKTLANVAGASPVSATIASFGPMFNNGSVDLAYAPAFAYNALELYKGLGNNGGIATFVLGQLSGQILIHTNQFPSGFGQKSRQWVFHNMFNPLLAQVKSAKQQIPNKYWVPINPQRTKEYRELFRKVRVRLWNEGWYSHKMQHLLKKIRCRNDPSVAECSEDTEGGPVP